MDKNEKAYHTMRSAGGGNIAIGVTVMIVGIISGIMLIINGARLLIRKKDITF